MKKLCLHIFILVFISSYANAQNNCQVMAETLKENYNGDCQNGKANGKGKAAGIDTYEGDFINGYPEGKGMYTWKDGHYYIGFFKKGKMEGAGDMYFESAKGEDSIVTGFWKKDKHIGLYEKAYTIISSTTRITKIDCRTAKKATAGGITITTGGVTYIPDISDIAVISGQYLSKAANRLSNGVVVRLQQMIFPFRAIFYLNNGEYFEMQFNEEVDYDVTVTVI